MDEPPRQVGAPTEYADAQEVPGCVSGVVLALFAVPVFLFRELPTLPLDGFIFAHEKGGRWGAGLYLLGLLGLLGLACWGLIRLVM